MHDVEERGEDSAAELVFAPSSDVRLGGHSGMHDHQYEAKERRENVAQGIGKKWGQEGHGVVRLHPIWGFTHDSQHCLAERVRCSATFGLLVRRAVLNMKDQRVLLTRAARGGRAGVLLGLHLRSHHANTLACTQRAAESAQTAQIDSTSCVCANYAGWAVLVSHLRAARGGGGGEVFDLHFIRHISGSSAHKEQLSPPKQLRSIQHHLCVQTMLVGQCWGLTSVLESLALDIATLSLSLSVFFALRKFNASQREQLWKTAKIVGIIFRSKK